MSVWLAVTFLGSDLVQSVTFLSNPPLELYYYYIHILYTLYAQSLFGKCSEHVEWHV